MGIPNMANWPINEEFIWCYFLRIWPKLAPEDSTSMRLPGILWTKRLILSLPAQTINKLILIVKKNQKL